MLRKSFGIIRKRRRGRAVWECNEGRDGLGRSRRVVRKVQHRKCVVFGNIRDGGGGGGKESGRMFHSTNRLKNVRLEDR
jgi:hypothetical protein